MALLDVDDLTPFAAIDEDKAEIMIADAEALASISAPCLLTPDDLTDGQIAGFKAVLRAAILRWNDSGTGAVSSQTAGPFAQSFDTRQTRRTMFWPSEISALQKLCKVGADDDGGAFSIDTAAEPLRFRSVVMPGSDSGLLGAVAFDADYTDDWPFL